MSVEGLEAAEISIGSALTASLISTSISISSIRGSFLTAKSSLVDLKSPSKYLGFSFIGLADLGGRQDHYNLQFSVRSRKKIFNRGKETAEMLIWAT